MDDFDNLAARWESRREATERKFLAEQWQTECVTCTASRDNFPACLPSCISRGRK